MTDLSIAVEIKQWAPLPAAVLHIDAPEWAPYRFGMVLEYGAVSSFDMWRADQSASPITARLLQRVPFGSLERALISKIEEFRAAWEQDNPDLPLFLPDQWPTVDEKPRINRDDLRLALLAEQYVKTLASPQQMAALAAWSREDPTRGNFSDSSVTKMVSRARQRGLLTRTTRGRRGGQLTPKALALLGRTREPVQSAPPAERLNTLLKLRLREQVEGRMAQDRAAGSLDGETYRARTLALDALLVGADPEQMFPDEPAHAIREATRWLKSTYEELDR